MIVKLASGEVTQWFLAFFPTCANPIVGKFVPGKYKHVNAFGWCPPARTWVFYEVALSGTHIYLIPGGEDGERVLGLWTSGASVLRMDTLRASKKTWRLGFWCVPAIRHLLGIPGGALLPDTLWRDCMKAGAKVVFNGFDARSPPG